MKNKKIIELILLSKGKILLKICVYSREYFTFKLFLLKSISKIESNRLLNKKRYEKDMKIVFCLQITIIFCREREREMKKTPLSIQDRPFSLPWG